ncbi:23S rRNA pseudouridine(2604) synthase RluF [Parabacteroides gordonii]|jgi:23S rRNA pseudouridine2604 synthase|uniref:23S rRNA pseudouridine(2604) synthase RluF n=1 Tax=Parabacteroides gordonii TaxID=574930 RepID=UPI00241CB6A2|nr:23S rRNA pseudouridine(2604) synthase RluF [Parabacteroides gordonii]
MQIRINKYISESGFCSRREADKYIEQGAVTLNGKKVEMGTQVLPGQVVRVFGEIISGKAESIIIAYNKPVGIVSTTDPAEKDNIVNAIGHSERIFPIGRLDKDSQGLLLLTNEGDIVNKILRVNNNHDKEYFVTVDKPVTADFIKRMQGGIPILGVVTRKCEITQKGSNSFMIVLRQGLNRQIRRMCESLGYNVTKLQRTRIMHIHLNDLKIGQYRDLTPVETETLYKKIANSVKTEEASAKKGKPARKSSATPKNSTVPKSQTVKSSPAKKERPASGSNFKSAKPIAGRKTSFNPKSKTQRRSR